MTASGQALTVVDLNPDSQTYRVVIGWNACSSSLVHEGHDMTGLSRRYLLWPGLRSSNVHIADTHPNQSPPRSPVPLRVGMIITGLSPSLSTACDTEPMSSPRNPP